MVIKSFKIFERGDGVEEENDKLSSVRKQVKQLEFDFNQPAKRKSNILPNYVLGIPSGEVVIIDDVNDLKIIIDRRMAEWTHDFRGKILNCYATSDKNLEKIKSLIEFLKREKVRNMGYKEICQDFIDEMNIVTGRKYICAYYEEKAPRINKTVPSYVLIIPDIDTNWKNFYKDVFTDMTKVLHDLDKKYPGAKFSFGPRCESKNVDIKFYGLPEED